MSLLLKVLLFSISSVYTVAFHSGCPLQNNHILLNTISIQSSLSAKSNPEHEEDITITSRKRFLTTASKSAALFALFAPNVVNAGIDPSALRSLPVDGDKSGAATRLRSLSAEEDKGKEEDLVQQPFDKLPSGVLYREYRAGTGDSVVQAGSKVATEMTIRCPSFQTTKEPGGLKYFSTKDDTDFNELAFTIGAGQILPGLEEGMMGMRKNSIRRIEVPSTMVFAGRNANQLPVPLDKNKDEKRVYDRLFKTDATLMFEVRVTRVK